MNRRVIDTVASFHFAPTATSAENLSNEKLGGTILVTGNTVIDALHETVRKIRTNADLKAELTRRFSFINPDLKTLLVTGHRRESFGDGFVSICKALARLAERSDLQIVYPVHLNPNVSGPVHELLAGAENVHLIEPQGYLDFVFLMQRADIIMTDSGGVQEEAPSMGKPVLVMRDVTERPEAVAAGTVKLVGTNAERIVQEMTRLLDDPTYYDAFARTINPYGDGKAAARIADALAGRAVTTFEPSSVTQSFF
ncbi:UDP-N-acetylglucosamine 2-epimerase [Martelella mediterranea]|uniref:UDP-N-acetylglucosamine 2-epimerase (non-hydrolyzing) n=1 Tax=Martelella mediterranea TaxID=293089 RepID=A0A4R3NSW4_9HYPH|nr:UDP-N-acetylglucosamine 2-epimerase [Martelella mediterranea]